MLDSAALISLDRNERAMWVRLKACGLAGEPPLTHGGVVGQVWRGGPRQARLAQAIAGIDVRPLDEDLWPGGRRPVGPGKKNRRDRRGRGVAGA